MRFLYISKIYRRAVGYHEKKCFLVEHQINYRGESFFEEFLQTV